MTRARLIPQIESGAALAGALRRGESAALDLLPALPQDAAAWGAAADAARARSRPLPPDALQALATRQTRLGAGPRAIENALRLGTSRAIVTGQQPGLLGGPLLTFHKAAGALALAARVEALTGRSVVPVFWLASEDHDLAEANRLTLLDRDGQPRQLALAEQADGRSLADRVVARESSAALEQQIRELLPDTPRARAALALLARQDDEPLSTWSARCLVGVLGDSGLVIVEPRCLAPWSGPALEFLVRHGRAIQDAVRKTVPALRSAGLAAPLDPRPDDLPLFVRAAPGAPRQRLGLRDDGRLLRDDRVHDIALDDLLAQFTRDPTLASPDVTGRVFVQNDLLPVLAYVAGPTELAYLAQVGAAHRAVGRELPLAVPRPSAVWADARVEETAADFGRTLDEILRGLGPAREPGHPAVAAFLGEVRAALEEQRQRAAPLLQGGSGGAQSLRSALDRLRAAWERAEPAVHAAYDADDGVASGRWTRLQNLLFPRGRPQERTLSILTPLARYGLGSVRSALEALDPLAEGVWLLRADEDQGSPSA